MNPDQLAVIKTRAQQYASAIGPGGEKAWLAGLLAADVPALLEALTAYDNALREAGIEHPLGPEGVRDLAAMARGRLEELRAVEQDRDQWRNRCDGQAWADLEQDRDRLSDELEQARQLVARYAPIAVPILADIKARKELAARMAAHTHYCWTCSDGTKPGDGCHNCRNTGMDQTPCVGCPGPQPANDQGLVVGAEHQQEVVG